MSPVWSTGASSAQPSAAGEDLFDAASYSDWVRGAVRVRENDPDVSILFESTISEPTDALLAVVQGAFSDEVTSRYVSVFADGNRFALQALAARYGLAPEQIVTTTGATGAISMVLRALVRAGDQVLVEQPGFDLLGRLATEAGATVAGFGRTAPGFGVDMASLRRALKRQTRAVLITNLHNPSGVHLAADEIKAVAAAAAEVGAVLVVDEVYADFAPLSPPAATLAPNIITVSSLTKVFGLFAIKFGWLAAAPALIDRIKLSAPDGDMGVSKLSHAIAAHVLEAPAPFEAHWREALAATRPLVLKSARRMRDAGLIEGEVPDYGCMYFPRIVGVDDTRTLARWLYREHRVLVAPGEYFGAPGHLRIGFGAGSGAIETGLQRLEAALNANR